MKKLFIAEKPSVARQFAEVLKVRTNKNGYMEDGDLVVTWCVGHLVTMSYPDAYDPKLKKWSMDTLPFIPESYRYEVIPAVKKQFQIVKGLLNREDVDTIYICTDSGREGEYIYRLVDQMAEVSPEKKKLRVWIDSQTEEEILRGIREAKPDGEYDNLSASAYLRAEEDYLMGINFSRALTLKYSYSVKQYLGLDKCVIAVGRVMTCVLGMIVRREREIRAFIPTPFYRLTARVGKKPEEADNTDLFEAEWHAVSGSIYENSPKLYKENGFKEKKDAEQLKEYLENPLPVTMKVQSISRKTEKKNPPMLYNLAELQNDCSKRFHINPSETLAVVQELYEKKLVTYPRTDARVLSTAVAKEIDRNIRGLLQVPAAKPFAENILRQNGFRNIAKSKYVNDKLITDHYAIIPTGQGMTAFRSLSGVRAGVYDLIVRRFLSIFYPPAEYTKVSAALVRKTEAFSVSFRSLVKPGYLQILDPEGLRKRTDRENGSEKDPEGDTAENGIRPDSAYIAGLRKGSTLSVNGFRIREGKTQPPKRYTSGSLILAMENAGQLIEDETLREQIKGSGIGTSATRDAIITKLVRNKYISLNKKTQVVTPTELGEIIHDVVLYSVNGLLRADLTASWEKGLTGVAEGTISPKEYNDKMCTYVVRYTNLVKQATNQNSMRQVFDRIRPYYRKGRGTGRTEKKTGGQKTEEQKTEKMTTEKTTAGK